MQEKNFEISIGQLVKRGLMNWWIILLAVIVCAGGMFAYTKLFTTPSYSSSAKIGVSSSDMTSYQDAIMGQTLATECSDILNGSVTLETAADMLNEYYDMLYKTAGKIAPREYTLNDLERMVSTSTSADTRYFHVTVTTSASNIKIDETGLKGEKQIEAAKEAAAKEEARIVCDYVVAAFGKTLAEHDIIFGAKVHTVDSPKMGAESSSNLVRNTLLGALVGFAASFGVVVLIGFMRNTIESEDWLASNFGEEIPVLAIIPDANDAKSTYGSYSKKYGYSSMKK
jgi:capsular polysaccharide biosynthesis protein